MPDRMSIEKTSYGAEEDRGSSSQLGDGEDV
jgi:hypothetical protein